MLGDAVGINGRTTGKAQAFGGGEVFVDDGDTGQRPQIDPTGQQGIDMTGMRHGSLGIEGNDGVDGRVGAGDLVKVGAEQLLGRNLAAGNRGSLVTRRGKDYFVHYTSPTNR